MMAQCRVPNAFFELLLWWWFFYLNVSRALSLPSSHPPYESTLARCGAVSPQETAVPSLLLRPLLAGVGRSKTPPRFRHCKKQTKRKMTTFCGPHGVVRGTKLSVHTHTNAHTHPARTYTSTCKSFGAGNVRACCWFLCFYVVFVSFGVRAFAFRAGVALSKGWLHIMVEANVCRFVHSRAI